MYEEPLAWINISESKMNQWDENKVAFCSEIGSEWDSLITRLSGVLNCSDSFPDCSQKLLVFSASFRSFSCSL